MITLKRKLNIKSNSLLAIINLLKSSSGNTRIVGGAVRDALMDINNTDIDIATNLLPAQVIKLLTQNGIKVINTGIKFGTVTAIINRESFEITTLRQDIDCKGRSTNVKYTKSFAQDALRRDFTINALSYCPIEHIIFDYFNGISDIQAKKVIFIGNPQERINEDYLRILRFFRFSCKYADKIDSECLEACIANKDKLSFLSGQRVKSELDLLLSLKKSPDILTYMFKYGILSELIPIKNYKKDLHIKAIDIASNFNSALELPIIYAILLEESDLSLQNLLQLKFTKSESKTILELIALSHIKTKSQIIIHLKEIWLAKQNYLLYFIYASLMMDDSSEINNLYREIQNISPPALPINAKELMKLGYKGKKLGEILLHIRKIWIENNFNLTRDQLINILDHYEK